MKKKIIIFIVIIVVCFVGYKTLFRKKPQPPAVHAVPVLVAKALQKTMPVQIEQIGTVEAYNSISIYSRVMGQLKKIHFQEGQDVTQGDMLFTIDPVPFEERLRAAEAKYSQDLAQLQFNESQAKRYQFLFEKGAVSRADYENQITLARTQEAIVKADKAEVDNAKTNLGYCFIKAPVSGKTGQFYVREGTMVKENDTKLTVINQITPVYVRFSVAEKQLPEIRQHMKKGALKVKVSVPGFKEEIQDGTLTFIDNTVDPNTGMILLKATFGNKEKFLWPGQFVKVTLKLYDEPDAVVIPNQAVQIAQDAYYTFIVRPDNRAEYRTIAVSRIIGDETVITKGIKPGETVVTDGHLKLIDGAPVEIRDSIAPKTLNNSKTEPVRKNQ